MGGTIADVHDFFNTYTLRQHQLEVVDHGKDLGVTMDVDLTLINIYQIRLIRFKRQLEVIQDIQRRTISNYWSSGTSNLIDRTFFMPYNL